MGTSIFSQLDEGERRRLLIPARVFLIKLGEAHAGDFSDLKNDPVLSQS